MCCMGCQGHVLQWTFSCLPQHVGPLLIPLQRPSWLSFLYLQRPLLAENGNKTGKNPHNNAQKVKRNVHLWGGMQGKVWCGSPGYTHVHTQSAQVENQKASLVRHAMCSHVFRALPHIPLPVRFSFHQRSLLSPKKLWALLSTFLPFSNLSIIMWALSNLKWPFPCTGFHYGS